MLREEEAIEAKDREVEQLEAEGRDPLEGLGFDEHTKFKLAPEIAATVQVTASLRSWLLARAGAGTDPARDPASGPVLVALISGWSSTVIHALAAEPLSVAELRRAVTAVDPATATEVLVELERTGIVSPQPLDGAARYGLTDWGREAVAPLIAAAYYERLHTIEDADPPDALDVTAAFQMALPLLTLPERISGRCRLSVWVHDGDQVSAGASAEIEAGRVASSSPVLEENPDTFIIGLPIAWCEAVLDPEDGRGKLKSAGDQQLISALLRALHERLFRSG